MIADVVFVVFLIATLCIHAVGYTLRQKGRLSTVLLLLGLVIVLCIGWQYYNTKQKVNLLQDEVGQAKNHVDALQRQVGRRLIDGKLFLSTLKDGPKGEAQIVYGGEDQDSWALAIQLRALLQTAGWTVLGIIEVPVKSIIKESVIVPENVLVTVEKIDQSKEARAILVFSSGQNAEPRTLYTVLSAALLRGLGRGVVGDADPALPSREVRITIFPR